MGYTVSNGTVTMLRNLKTNLEYRLMENAHRLQLMTSKSTQISEKYSQRLTGFLQDADDDFIYAGDLTEVYAEFKPELDRVQAAEKELELEKINLEAELKAINSSIESYEKLTDQGIKESVMKSGS